MKAKLAKAKLIPKWPGEAEPRVLVTVGSRSRSLSLEEAQEFATDLLNATSQAIRSQLRAIYRKHGGPVIRRPL